MTHRACLIALSLLIISGCTPAPEPTGNEDLSEITLNVYWAKWCGPCMEMKPTWARLAATYPDVTVLYTDVDKNQRAAQRDGISAIPQAVVSINGNEVGRITGPHSYNQVVYRLTQIKQANN